MEMKILLLTSIPNIYGLSAILYIMLKGVLNLPSKAIDKETHGEGANDSAHRENSH